METSASSTGKSRIGRRTFLDMGYLKRRVSHKQRFGKILNELRVTKPAFRKTMDVEFRAGKMKLDGRMLRADERKGTIRVFLSAEDGVVHFTWLKRPSGSAEVQFKNLGRLMIDF
jgi:hypothetical protein